MAFVPAPMGQAAAVNWGNCTCNIGCATTSATLRKINVLKKPTSNNLGQSKAMRYAQFSNTTPGLETVGNKKQVFVSQAPTCVLPGRSVVDGTQCRPNVGDWTAATKTKFTWLTGCPGGLACNGQNQTTLNNPSYTYSYPNRMFGRFQVAPVTSSFV
jgi:hypothetical protein